MAKVKIDVTISRTIQTAPYESSKVEITEQHILEDDEDPAAVRVSIFKALSEDVERFVKHEKRKYTAVPKENR